MSATLRSSERTAASRSASPVRPAWRTRQGPPYDAGGGRALDAGRQQSYGERFGHDFSAVRVHDDERASASARALGARGYVIGADVVLDREQAPAASMRREQVLAHELVHVAQQRDLHASTGASPVGAAAAEHEARTASASALAGRAAPIATRVEPQVQTDLVDPDRLKNVNRDLFPPATTPGAGTGGGVTLSPWVNASPGVDGTAADIIKQAKAAVKKLVKDDPSSVGGETAKNTTEANLDSDALDANKRLRARYPQITITVSDKQISDAVSVIGPKLTDDPDYLHQWLANKLIGWTNVEDFAISEKDPRFVKMLDDLLADKEIGKHLKTLASRIAGFQRGVGTAREIFVHEAAPAAQRPPILLHELTHFYANDTYEKWVAKTSNGRFFNEGFTEWLARRAMTADEKSKAKSYQDRFEAIDTKVAKNVPEDDIARAFFGGEVWRIESKSAISQTEFATASGIREGATLAQESADSRTGPGLNEEVAKGAHYRFINLGNDRAEPKQEHVDFFDTVKAQFIDRDPDVRVRFEGHASTVGSESHNQTLSLQRAQAFYKMAKAEGVPSTQLVDEVKPPHFGESKPTLTEEDAQTRAFNRRVEMTLTQPAAPAKTGGTTSTGSKDE